MYVWLDKAGKKGRIVVESYLFLAALFLILSLVFLQILDRQTVFKTLDLEILLLELCFKLHLCLSSQELSYGLE